MYPDKKHSTHLIVKLHINFGSEDIRAVSASRLLICPDDRKMKN
jgi:hypothetical protein